MYSFPTKKGQQINFATLFESGGRERIRTAVRGFADLCLATRPRDHFPNGWFRCYDVLYERYLGWFSFI